MPEVFGNVLNAVRLSILKNYILKIQFINDKYILIERILQNILRKKKRF